MTPRPRVDQLAEIDGIWSLEVFEPRKRFGPKWLGRQRWGVASEPVAMILARLPDHSRRTAECLLREGIGRRRRWSSLVDRPPEHFEALVAEHDVLPVLVAAGAVRVWDRWSPEENSWRVRDFRTEPAGHAAIGHRTADEWRTELAAVISDDRLREALTDGSRGSMGWEGFGLVLQAAQRWLAFDRGGSRPDERELAGLVGDTKCLRSESRRVALARLVGVPLDDLFPTLPRILNVRGWIRHDDGDVWDSTLLQPGMALLPGVRALLCVENLETFRRMSVLADLGAIVLQVPGGPPPAEVLFVERIHALAPRLPLYAVFDPDPAGIRIARILEDRAGVRLRPDFMSPDILAAATQLELKPWDVQELERLRTRAGALEPLRAAMESRQRKGEQETVQRPLVDQARTLLGA